MTTTPNATPDADRELQVRILDIVRNAYAPEDCESCEVAGGTCQECAEDALEEAGIRTAWS